MHQRASLRPPSDTTTSETGHAEPAQEHPSLPTQGPIQIAIHMLLRRMNILPARSLAIRRFPIPRPWTTPTVAMTILWLRCSTPTVRPKWSRPKESRCSGCGSAGAPGSSAKDEEKTRDDDDDGMLRMSFLGHLEDLRKRLCTCSRVSASPSLFA